YLEIPITEDWYKRSKQERREYIQGWGTDIQEEGEIVRNKICIAEVWNELYNGDSKNIHPAKAAEIRQVLSHLSGWEKNSKGNKGRLRFGPGYGVQVAYLRVTP
ncbi:hypothetical protein JFL08_15440, partial [Enterococcus faecalis]|nr:hypothetical protein [Enterococcus faecalis]MDT6549331.1 hypothetical protein [Enterococcus faecalis]HBE2210373.1 hypothetical protein [Enterococcus faecalis]